MLLSDNETKIDMLNNKAIAKSVVKLITENDNRPISVGIHGDWGAGKSSVLAMIEEDFLAQAGYECIRFNGWKHQGFEDAKIALMSSIVSELSEKSKLGEKCKDTLKKLWKNINWISAAKATGSIAVSLATGMPPIGLLTNTIDDIKDGITNQNKVNDAVDSIGQYLTDAKVFENTSLAKEFSEFQVSFAELLNKSNIDKLVVLVDDLDRCLPKVTIETMEAIRLFMFSESTAFVIAADEGMMKYAVSNHFPNLPNESGKDMINYSDKYLEKLIQVPFHIPALGQIESGMYITLLLIGSVLKEDDEDFMKLLGISLEKMKRPWKNFGISNSDIQRALGETKYKDVISAVQVANQISTILSKNTQGNPRKIKRFINMLLLRKQIADARGFGEDIFLPELAKLMLAEYYFSNEYIKIAEQTNDDGVCIALAKLEEKIRKPPVDIENKEDEQKDRIAIAGSRNEVERTKNADSDIVNWLENEDFTAWAKLEPQLGKMNLLPYFFASKRQVDYFFEEIKSQKIKELITKLMSESMVIASAKDDIINLTKDESKIVFMKIKERIQSQSYNVNAPKGIEGVRVLVSIHDNLQEELLSLIESFDLKVVGPWICTGWIQCIKSENAKKRWNVLCDKIASEGSALVKNAVKNAKL